MKKHKWKKETDARYVCLKCGIEKWKIRQIWGGWEYMGNGIRSADNSENSTIIRPECVGS